MMLRDVPMAMASGQLSLVAPNTSWSSCRWPPGIPRGVPVPDGKIDDKVSLGEASSSCGAGAGDGIKSGAVGWITLTLAPDATNWSAT